MPVRTYTPKASEIRRAWYVVDAEGLVLGRMATEVARVLRGKHKPIFAPHLDTGDHVIVVNASKVVLTAGKGETKLVRHHTGYPGGLKSQTYGELLAAKPEEAIRRTVRGHAPEEPPGPLDAEEAEGLRRPDPPALGAAAPAPRDRARPRQEHVVTKPLTQTTGRRKEAVARVRLRPGTGKITVNKRELATYFPSRTHQMIVTEPLRVAGVEETYDVDVTIHGGGVSGQAGALRMGIARSLVELDPELRVQLKRAGFLTRDAREKESKKYGLKKARKAPQYSKR